MKSYILYSGISGFLTGTLISTTKISMDAENLRQVMIDYTAFPVAALICAYIFFLIVLAIGKSLFGASLPKLGDSNISELGRIKEYPVFLIIYIANGVLLVFLCGYVASSIGIVSAKYLYIKGGM